MSDFKVLFITNMIVACAWIAGAYYLATSGHETMGAWCIVGALFSGYSFSNKTKNDSD